MLVVQNVSAMKDGRMFVLWLASFRARSLLCNVSLDSCSQMQSMRVKAPFVYYYGSPTTHILHVKQYIHSLISGGSSWNADAFEILNLYI
jgi:hypothetical protein